MGKVKYVVILMLMLCACAKSKKVKMSTLVEEWTGKEIVFPDSIVFTMWGQDTMCFQVLNSPYKIINYSDSLGCLSCDLQLLKWKAFITELDLAVQYKIPVLLFFGSKNIEEITFILKRDKFNYPVCIDKDDAFYKLNHFSTEMAFQTFLLDKDNKVIAIGNPIYNSQIKELYLNIIQGKYPVSYESERIRTEVDINDKNIFLGKFDWQQEQKVVFILRNTGTNPLVVNNVSTSCGCTFVEYSQEPVRPGDSISLRVAYKANHPEHFDKTITVYCNAKPSPVVLKITGDAY